MSTGLVRRARALRLVNDILSDEQRSRQLEELILLLERQGAEIEGLLKREMQLDFTGIQDSKVIPLANHQKPKTARHQFSVFNRIIDRRYIIQTPCLLEGQDPLERRKVALEIHSRTSRVAFLDFSDLKIFQVEDLLELSESTLFISELRDLSPESQTIIGDALKLPQPPLFISGTELSLSVLRSHPSLNPSILNALSTAHFRLQHRLKYYLEHGFFKLFLESLS